MPGFPRRAPPSAGLVLLAALASAASGCRDGEPARAAELSEGVLLLPAALAAGGGGEVLVPLVSEVQARLRAQGRRVRVELLVRLPLPPAGSLTADGNLALTPARSVKGVLLASSPRTPPVALVERLAFLDLDLAPGARILVAEKKASEIGGRSSTAFLGGP